MGSHSNILLRQDPNPRTRKLESKKGHRWVIGGMEGSGDVWGVWGCLVPLGVRGRTEGGHGARVRPERAPMFGTPPRSPPKKPPNQPGDRAGSIGGGGAARGGVGKSGMCVRRTRTSTVSI